MKWQSLVKKMVKVAMASSWTSPSCLIPIAQNKLQWPLAQGGHKHLLDCHDLQEDEEDEDADIFVEDDDDNAAADDDHGWPTNMSMTLGTRCTRLAQFSARMPEA